MEALKIFPEYNYKIQNEKGKIYVQFKSRVRKFVDGKWYLMDIKDTYYLGNNNPEGILMITRQFIKYAYTCIHENWVEDNALILDKCQLNESERLKAIHDLEMVRIMDDNKESELELIEKLGGGFHL